MGKHEKIMLDQLGMPYGTAQNRLRKLILFDCIQKLGLDTCVFCYGKIVAVSTLCTGHTTPWLHSDDPIGLFFELTNVNFSHLSCNRRQSIKIRYPCPSAAAYKLGCRCDGCRKAKAESRHTKSSNLKHTQVGYREMIEDQLGMRLSTAQARLRKLILFGMSKRLELDTCFRCGGDITDINTFSVEHMIPWLYDDNAKELYFDIQNISFSHRSCNIRSARKTKPTIPCPSLAAFQRGCRCAGCHQAKQSYHREWYLRKKNNGKET